MSVTTPAAALGLVADEARWRLLRLVARERLNVSELTRVLGLAQSGVSRHLHLLEGAGLVHQERRGGWTYAGLAPLAPAGLERLWPALAADLALAPDPHGDDARLAEVLSEREERGGPGASAASDTEPGRSWAAWSQALGHLLPGLEVVHLGAGDGALTAEVARWAGRVTAVERADPGSAPAARPGGRGRRPGAVRWSRAPLAVTGLPAASFDVALLAQALPVEADPTAVLREACRLLKPHGRALVLDLLPHDQAWVRSRWGHLRQGVTAATLRGWMTEAGLVDARVEPSPRRRGHPFVVLIGSGRRPGLEVDR